MDDFVKLDDLPVGSVFRVRGEDTPCIKMESPWPSNIVVVRLTHEGIMEYPDYVSKDTMVEPGSIEFIPNRRSK